MPRSSQHCSPCRRRTQPGFSTSWRRPDTSPARRGRASSTAAEAIVSRLVLFVAVAVDVVVEMVVVRWSRLLTCWLSMSSLVVVTTA